VIGKPFPAVERPRQGDRRDRFTVDVALPGMLHGRILRSPLPHARVRSDRCAAAARHPGARRPADRANPDDPQARVRYVGAPVAAVAAVSMAAAEEALR
jgi:xanthine dehydrogenase YagR molybdenum-binding subunit